jgi:hypothetical protein
MIFPPELERELTKPFSLETWRSLLQELLPGLSLFGRPQEIPLLSKAERAVAESLRQFGTARLADGKGIGLFVIEAKPDVDISRNRVGLRQLSARWINQADIHAALTLSYQPDVGFYRLTYAARETVFTPDLQLSMRETATRRFTYILGEGERRRTAAQRLALLADRRPELQLQDVTDAFSVEKLNKEFFTDFCRARVALTDELHSHGRLSVEHARVEAQIILNRLLFLYFLQRKGWLNRQRDYLASGFARFVDNPTGTDFYKNFLAPVFAIVSTEWAQREKVTVHLEEENPHAHDLPFLNGGLFADELAAAHTDDAVRRRRGLRIRNEVFQRVFADLFERYNFTIHEDSERDAEVAVDPEMLGRIFEELVLTGEDSESGGKSRRHDTGSHYTPRPIVRYLCRDSLAAWLADKPPFRSHSEPRVLIDSLLNLDASVGLDEATWTKLRELLTAEEAGAALDVLSDLRACDPAVGSGAFPLGLLHELVNLARLLESRARGKDPAEIDSDWLYNTKKRLIERCLYGVDNQEEALEICKLRLWLSLMVDHELGVDPGECNRRSFASALKKLEPLPNLEFKIRRANALIDTIRGHRLFVDRPRQDDAVRIVISDLRDAKHEFYNAATATKKNRLRFKIYQAIAKLAQHELSWMKRHRHGLGLNDSDEIGAQLAELQAAERALGHVRDELDRAHKLKKTSDQEDALERLRLWWDDPKAPTFVWHFDFAEVFHRVPRVNRKSDFLIEEEEGEYGAVSSSAGFDQMIGNPPYVRIQVLKRKSPKDVEWYREHYAAAKKGNYDLYVVFIERALKLLHGRGQLAFICPHRFFQVEYGEPLRGLISRGKHLRHVVHFGNEQVFPGATNYVCLLFLSRSPADECRFVKSDKLKHWLATQTGEEGSFAAKRITTREWNFVVGKAAAPFEHLDSFPIKLGKVADLFVGIQTDADDVFLLKREREDRSYVWCASEFTGQIHPFEKHHLKPFLKGSLNVRRYWLDDPTRLVLFPYETHDGRSVLIEADEYAKRLPKTWQYLNACKSRLDTATKKKAGLPWHAYVYKKNHTRFESPKLLAPAIATGACFASDPQGIYYFVGSGAGGGGGYGIVPIEACPLSSDALLAVLNSSISTFFLRLVSAPFANGYIALTRQFIENLPIPQANSSQQRSLENLAAWLLFLYCQPSVRAATEEHPRDPQMAAWFERWVNALVYELFFPEELRARGIGVFPLTQDLAPPPPVADATAAATLTNVRTIVNTLSAPGHVLRRTLDQLQTLDLVRTIEGGA